MFPKYRIICNVFGQHFKYSVMAMNFAHFNIRGFGEFVCLVHGNFNNYFEKQDHFFVVNTRRWIFLCATSTSLCLVEFRESIFRGVFLVGMAEKS